MSMQPAMWSTMASAVSGTADVSSILNRVTIKFVPWLIHGTKVGEIDLRTEVEGGVQLDVAPQVGFWRGCKAVERLPVIPTLESIANEVSDVIELFRADLQ